MTRTNTTRPTAPVSEPDEQAPASQANQQMRSEPQPWHRPEDAAGWRVVARGKRQPGRLSISETITVTFDPEQAGWLAAESMRRGVDYETVVKTLVDAARQAARE